jgi:hypothetical protein
LATACLSLEAGQRVCPCRARPAFRILVSMSLIGSVIMAQLPSVAFVSVSLVRADRNILVSIYLPTTSQPC